MTESDQYRSSRAPYQTFLGLSEHFHRLYFDWHTKGQYEGVREFGKFEDVYTKIPPRERDDWYNEELRIIDQYYCPLADSRILEIGCGDGNLTWKLADRCRSMVSCDLDPQAIELTRVRLRELGLSDRVSLSVGSVKDIDSRERESYDIVFFVQVLEHVPARMQCELFESVFGLVAPGGCLFVSTPNRWTVRDAHDTGKLFIHWFPRWVRIPIAKVMNWGIQGQDPCWPCPPILHDYVSYRWMMKKARSLYPSGIVASSMRFYPSMDEWFRAKEEQGGKGANYIIRKIIKYAGKFLPLNYYFGDKVIFYKVPR